MHVGHIIDLQAAQADTHRISRYLFRVVSDGSAGINREGCFQSEAVKQDQRAAMEDMSEDLIRENLRDHMQAKKNNMASHWISFTSSFLWALDRALRLKKQGHQDVRIAIIDTLHLPSAGTKIFSARALLMAYDVNLFLKNSEGAERLVWDEIIAPFTLVPLDEFLKGVRIEKGMVKEGLPQIQPQHFKPLGDDVDTILEQLTGVLRANLRAPCKLRPSNYSTDRDKQHETDIRRSQAPRYFGRVHMAGRMFTGKKLNYWWLKNDRFPMAAYTMYSFMQVVKDHFPLEFQFPVLIALLSARLSFFEPDSVVSQLQLIKGESTDRWLDAPDADP